MPQPLLDRLEVIQLSGYTEEEKLQIAKKHLVPKLISEHGISKADVTLSQKIIEKVITSYTNESGVRGLEKKLAKLVRNRAKQIAFEEEFRKKTVEKAQKAVFNLGKLPTLTINVKMKQKKYFIIAGAFRISQNAENLTAVLKRKGYDASILGLNDKGLNPVSFSSFNNRKEAVTQLRIIQRKENKDAWIFESY